MDLDEDIEIGRRTWVKATVPIQQDAYREGFDIGRQDHFQQGFDRGYIEGFRNGFLMGVANATLRSAKELDSKEIDHLQLATYESPHRGRCAICPSEKHPFSKDKMAEVSSQYQSLEQVIEKQSRVVFPEEAIKTILSLLEPKS